MKEICVVHLVRAHNGIEPFRRFIESYRSNPGEIEHELLIVFKGFLGTQDTAKYRKLLAPFTYRSLEISDEGVDITAYFSSFKHCSDQYRYFCFLNSFSEIQDREWLKKLYIHICRPDVGLAGATGSWQGMGMRVPNHGFLNMLKSRVLSQDKKESVFHGLTYIAKGVWRRILFPLYFHRFPNYHLRTNAFIISSENMKKLKCPTIKSKMDAYKFESGKKGLTKQVLDLGKRILVVGKDGIGYEMTSWNKSKTFWQSEQENLLVADNQSREYQNGEPEKRRLLSFSAWGKTSIHGDWQAND